MDSKSVAEAKSSLRQRLMEKRNLESLSNSDLVSQRFTSQLIAAWHDYQSTTVACYLAFGSEPNTQGFIDWALTNEIDLLLPVARPDGELHWVHFDGSSTAVGMFGFAEPVGDLADLSTAGLIFIPALAVDENGNRLGKGKGYYDRALKANPHQRVIAVVYDSEVLPAVPTESHDFKVDGFVTESRLVILAN
ncbi:MAG: hypothetical protein RL670_47 [Actinomycetota bacterium]